MRSFLVSTVVGLCVTTMALTGSAQESAPKLGAARPKIELAPPVRVVGFHRSGQTGMYTGGALGIGVDVENTGNTPVDNVSVKLDIGGGKVIEQAISIAPRGTRTATFLDTDGLASSCSAAPYKITLSGPGTGAKGSIREARITPSCTFSSKLEETWNLMSPDKVEAEKAGNAYLTAPALQSNATCGGGPNVKVRIVNKSSLGSPSIIVQAKEWSAGGQVKAQTAAAFPIAASESKDLVLGPVAKSGGGEPTAKLKIGIVDWTKSLQGRTSDGGIFVNTTRSCTLAFALD